MKWKRTESKGTHKVNGFYRRARLWIIPLPWFQWELRKGNDVVLSGTTYTEDAANKIAFQWSGAWVT